MEGWMVKRKMEVINEIAEDKKCSHRDLLLVAEVARAELMDIYVRQTKTKSQ